MLTEERAMAITEVLAADEARAKALLSLEPEEALKQINALGNDFTVDELREYGNVLSFAAKKEQGELSVDSLDDVSGGGAKWDAFRGFMSRIPWNKVGGAIQGAINGWQNA